MSQFTQFTDALETYLSADHAIDDCAHYVAGQLRQLIAQPTWLEECHRQGCIQEPQANLVYVSPQGHFSVVAFVWQAGQQTCIHDHVCWCVVGVLQGVEQETSYRLKRIERQQPWLEFQETRTLEPGHVCQLVPPHEDIHQVRNIGSETAISIHVYGTDIGKRGTSINRRFDNLSIQEHTEDSVPVNWRTLNLGEAVGIQLES